MSKPGTKRIGKKAAIDLLRDSKAQLIYDTVSAKFFLRMKDLSARYWLTFDGGIEIKKLCRRIDNGGTIEYYEILEP